MNAIKPFYFETKGLTPEQVQSAFDCGNIGENFFKASSIKLAVAGFDGSDPFYCGEDVKCKGQKLRAHQVPRWIKLGIATPSHYADRFDQAAFYSDLVGRFDGITQKEAIKHRKWLGLDKPVEKPTIKIIAGNLLANSINQNKLRNAIEDFCKGETPKDLVEIDRGVIDSHVSNTKKIIDLNEFLQTNKIGLPEESRC